MRCAAFQSTWAWIVSGVLSAGAVVLACAMDGQFGAPYVDWLPERACLVPQFGADADWQPRRSVAENGWLPESRFSDKPAFDVRRSLVPVADILDMPPGPEGIPPLDDPRLEPAVKVNWLKDNDEVVAINLGQVTRCYPLPLLRWHNVVNDVVGVHPVAVLFDPLSGASLAFSRTVGDTVLSFGVSGKAYDGCALLFDRETRSLWYPLHGRSLTGPLAGRHLQLFPVERTTWAAWRGRHPRGEVLSRETGFGRPYEMDPYAEAPIGAGGKRVNYWRHTTLVLAPVLRPLPERGLPAKVLVLGVRNGAAAVAVAPPAKVSRRVSFTVELGGRTLRGIYDPRVETREFRVFDSEQTPPWQITCFWFAWQAAYPHTKLVRLVAPRYSEAPDSPLSHREGRTHSFRGV